MKNLLKKNNAGQIVSAECPYNECTRNPNCYDCSFVSHDDIKEMMYKLYKYEQTGLIFKEN